jgi:D-alanyl-D-alanine carboxypeptidase
VTPSATAALTAEDIDAVGARVQAAATALAGKYPGISVYLRVGDQTTTLVAGVASRAPELAMTPAVRFEIASITKSMTATLVMRLVEQGTLSLGDRVSKWLPRVLVDGDEITIAMLLTHSSGLFNFTELGSWDWASQTLSATELVALAEKHGRAFAPGERAEYSNTNYVVLGLVVEAATRMSLRDAMRAAVFKPAGMSSARLGTKPVNGVQDARGYSGDVDVTTSFLDGAAAAGGVVATAEDVGRFIDALFEGRLVSAETVADMASVHSQLEGSDGYGYGLDPFAFDCAPLVGHLGSLPGFSTSMWRRVDGTRTVVILINGEPSWEETVSVLTPAVCD